MEKTLKSTDERSIGYGPAYVISASRPDRLVGRVLSIIEAMGLPEKQENSVKELIRQEIYNTLELEVWIPGRLNTMIKEFYDWYEKDGNGGAGGLTTSRGERFKFINGEFELNYKED